MSDHTHNHHGSHETPPAQNLTEQFARIEWLLHRYHQHNRLAHGPMGDPHRGQGRILALLRMQPEISQRELSYLLDMRPQSLGELLTKLEKSGYIRRLPSDDDRRAMNIQLTESGKNAAENGEGPSEDDAVFECISPDERQQLQSLLRRVIGGLEERMGDTLQMREDMRRNREFVAARRQDHAQHLHDVYRARLEHAQDGAQDPQEVQEDARDVTHGHGTGHYMDRETPRRLRERHHDHRPDRRGPERRHEDGKRDDREKDR